MEKKVQEQSLSNVKSDIPLNYPPDKVERLDQESLARFKDIQLPFFKEKILRLFPCNLWQMPLPVAKQQRALIPTYTALGLTLLILYSTQNWIASLVIIALGFCATILYRHRIAYRQFFPMGYGKAIIKIDENKISLPGIYFENNMPQDIDKSKIRNIIVYWNWCKSLNNISYHNYYSGYIFLLDLELENAQHILLPGTSFDCNRFMETLFQLGYETQLLRVEKRPMLWRFILIISVAFYLLWITVLGFYKIFSGDHLF